jgi:hypothetical protein
MQIRARHAGKRHLISRNLRTMYLMARQERVMHLRIRYMRAELVMVSHVRVMHAMIWNVREMRVWAYMSGQGMEDNALEETEYNTKACEGCRDISIEIDDGSAMVNAMGAQKAKDYKCLG